MGTFENCLKDAIVTVLADYRWIHLIVGKSIMPYVVELGGNLKAGSADTTGSFNSAVSAKSAVQPSRIMFIQADITFKQVLGVSHRAHLRTGSTSSRESTALRSHVNSASLICHSRRGSQVTGHTQLENGSAWSLQGEAP